MKRLLLVMLMGFAPAVACADAKAGEKKVQLCLLCHKPNNTMAYLPTLEGQTREYLYAQIKAFKEKRRADSAMQTNVATLSERDMRDIADYFASRKPVRASFQLVPEKVSKGEAKAKALQCGSCHMPDYSGKKEAPRLAGLEPKYIAPQIVAMKSGKRPHPPIADALSDEDADNLAQYFAQVE